MAQFMILAQNMNLRERDKWGDPGVDGRIILRWIFRKWDVGYGLDWVGSG
jgi:hypothetical protein